MDPIANICEQLSISRGITKAWDNCQDTGTLSPEQSSQVAENANRLAELVIALHEWQKSGGFSPYKGAR